MKTTRIAALIFILSIVGFGSLAKPHTARATSSTFPITGYAWSENIGWIDLNCSNTVGLCSTSPFGLTIDASGNITGYAWSENIGWISANSADLAGCPQSPCTATITSGGAMNGWMKVLSADGYNTSASTQYSTTTYSTPTSPVASTFGTTGTGPNSIAIDSAGNIYTANYSSNNVTKITPAGVSTTFGTTGSNPQSIAIDSSGNVYTANYGSNNVTKITPAGVSTTINTFIGSSGVGPIGITIDSSGNVYTANYGSNNVTKITPASIVTAFGATGSGPYGMTIDSSGNIYTSNVGSNNVTKITPAGVSTTFGTTGTNARFIAVDSAGNIYTANYVTTTLTKITPASVSTTFSVPASFSVAGIAIDSSNNVYTGSVSSNSVIKITPAGVSTTFGTTGSGPYGMTIDSAGSIYTSNIGGNNVTKFISGIGTQSYVVPANVTSLGVTLLGSGGATTTTTVAVTPGETLSVTMGQSSGQTTLNRGATTLVSGSGELILVSSTTTSSSSIGWTGFISLSGTSPSYGVTETGGNFSGYSWTDDVMGWTDWHYASTTYGTCTPSYSCSGSQITYTNSSCVISNYGSMCVSPAFCSSGSASCLYPSPSVNPGGALTASPKLIPVGKTTTVSWNIANVQSCTTKGTNGDSWSGLVGTKTSKAITAQTTYTLSCVPDDPTAPLFTQSVTLNLVPTYRER